MVHMPQHGDVLEFYAQWPTPVVIISDGPYGLGGYTGDPRNTSKLAAWYAPHIAWWAQAATPETTLWFWGTELSWATVHPVMRQHGWHYAECSVWDKGKTHIAGNVNSKTIRGLPVTTEVCCRYTRTSLAVVPNVTDTAGKTLPANEWLRAEWQRTGLPLRETNAACGVRDAATRKYFTTEADLWYPPPEKRMEKLRQYVAKYGDAAGAPYFSLSVQDTRAVWSRAKWNHQHGLTNVWSEPPVRGAERVKRHGKTLHPNQKPLRLMEQLLLLSSDVGDVVWEPFGGLCTAAVAAQRVGRECYCAEVEQRYWEAAAARLKGDIVPETPKLPKKLGLWGGTRR